MANNRHTINFMNTNEAKKPVVCIFCSSSADVSSTIKENGAEFAGKLAHNGLSLLYGGTTCGLMKVVADAHKSANGCLLGVIPRYMVNKGIQHEKLDKVFVAEDLRDRKQVMLDHSDIIIALPGGIGTYDEFFDLLAMKQLKRHNKPMFLFNIAGYFEPLLAMLEHSINENTVKREYMELFGVAGNADDLLNLVKASLISGA
jgi:uncharacterized protein (TIGR00730 family)